MTRLALCALALTGTALADPCKPPAHSQFGGTVEKVYDGDTLKVGCVRVRLGDIDTPERREPGYQRAKDMLTDIALGRWVDCLACAGARKECRSHGRTIAICRLESGETLGDLMRARGAPTGGR